MDWRDVGVQLVVGFGVVGVTLVLSVVIVNALFRVNAVLQLAAGRLRCLAGRHGWITVTFSSTPGRPSSRYRVCATCRRREYLPVPVPN